jgi:hypothetical protein
MITDVLRLQGNYLVQSQVGGVITFDVGGATSTGTVVIEGNLDVRGQQTFIESTIATIKDQTVVLNSGDPGASLYSGVGVTGVTSGLQIARGDNDSPDLSAFIEWNESSTWRKPGVDSPVRGLFEFRRGPADGSPQYSAIKVGAIRLDEDSAELVDGVYKLSFLGSDNSNSVLSAGDHPNYTALIKDKNDIPNKEYVDIVAAGGGSGGGASNGLNVGNSWVKIVDRAVDGVTSAIVGVVDGDSNERLTVTTGTVVLRVTSASAQILGIQILGSQIQPVSTNKSLTLSASGTGQVLVNSPLILSATRTAVPGVGQVGLYTGNPAAGGTGVFFVNSSTTGTVTSGEMINRKRALVFSLIF